MVRDSNDLSTCQQLTRLSISGQKETMKKDNTPYHFWPSHNATIVLFVLIIIFMSFSVFIALNVKPGIIPDEVAHYAFSKVYASTWGIPADVSETYQYGWYIKQNPFLYYWVNGRALNLLNIFLPSATDWQKLVFLRLISSLYASGTVLFCYLFSKEVIKNKWWQLLPVFLLSNTLMFVFLSGGVNYDNLANLFCMAGLYFLTRALNRKDYVSNSLGWMICICLGTLIKYPILPLALAMGVAWLIFTLKHRKALFPLTFAGPKLIVLGGLLVLLIFGNLAIYGVNLVTYHAILPKCTDLLSDDQCAISPYVQRYEEIRLDHKLSILESIQLGYPDPFQYVIDSWIPNMLYRIYGILGHLSYFPSHIIIFYRLLLLWFVFLLFKYWGKHTYIHYSLIGIILFYALVLLLTNYNSELIYGFKQIAMQGRYIFPVIGAAYIIYSNILMNVPNKILRIITLIVTIALFILGGPIKFIIRYGTIFLGWFI